MMDWDEGKVVFIDSSLEEEEQEQEQEMEENMRGSNAKTISAAQSNGNPNAKGKLGCLCRFPESRVRRLMRAEAPGDGFRATKDAVFLINKATERFLQVLSGDACVCSLRDRKRCIGYKHLSSVVCKKKRYEFLSDFVPKKIKAKEALEARASTETGS
ncbi:hypothetical protein QJS04_geneDACA005641 [Acorus gramineus]|uniref:Transcription factor CBF/NF-Y/archaeal histone domain-containing protein n=1 Tax=Acorus gramineus TaxID=55184 RepID=A0AAV9A543_ACOGR|nr:hypothetical protein QJS04_geneDACA005641 [Acorus gramineus]